MYVHKFYVPERVSREDQWQGAVALGPHEPCEFHDHAQGEPCTGKCLALAPVAQES